jgi:large subunit ribosomal protein L32
MVNHMRHTRAHTANRRSHHALKGVRLSACPDCGAQKQAHKICVTCGKYKGKVVLNVHSKIEKREKKAKQAAAK